MRAAWQALLAGDLKRRDELVTQAKRLLHLQRAAGVEEWLREQKTHPIQARLPPVIYLPDESSKVLS